MNIMKERGGSGMDAWIRACCTCGWRGSKHYAHNDYQYSNYADEVKNHKGKCNESRG